MNTLKIFFWLLVGTVGLLAQAGAQKPNIVFVLADDLGIYDLHCYGREEHRTPNLDNLAGQGMRFTSAYCAQPICSPSRAGIMTGKNPARLHLTTYLPGRPDCPSQQLQHPVIKQQLPLEERTLAERLKDQGYVTGCIGKWHLGNKGFTPREQGFDFYHPGQAVTKPSATEGGKGEYDLTAQAERFMEENRERPFFLYLAHNSPHIPYSAKTHLIESNAKALEPVYAAVIETLDDTVGKLLAKLETLGLAKNTIVIFTSDNGGLHVPEGPHPVITHNGAFRAGKGFVYEGGLRIPLIVRWPGHVPAGKVTDAPAVNTDWLPTLFELAGLPQLSDPIDGRSFASLLLGKRAEANRRFFWHFPHYTNQGSQPAGAVREGDWKLIEHYESGRLELYNLKEDPREQQDLASQQPEKARQLQKLLAEWRQNASVQTNSLNPNFDPAMAAPLYVEMDVSRYNAAKASKAEREKILAWRKQMNAAVNRKR